MNKTESAQILRIISTAFPSYKPQYDNRAMKEAIDLWSVMFNDVPMPIVAEAVKKYISGNNEFAPSIGNIKTIVDDIIGRTEVPASEAWNMVLKALKNGIYGSEKEFNRLPKDIQDAIGSPEYLHSLAVRDDVNLSVESSNFYKQYSIAVQRRKNTEALPDKIKLLADQINGNTIKQLQDSNNTESNAQKETYSMLVAEAKERAENDSYEKVRPIEELHPAFRKLLASADE